MAETISENQSRNSILINENGVISLNEDHDLDFTTKLNIKLANNLKIEVKYPSYERITTDLVNSDLRQSHLKEISINVQPLKEKSQTDNLCEEILGIYPNLGYDPINKEHKIIIQGFVPKRALSNQQKLRIGDMLYSINNIKINSLNIHQILLAISSPQKIKLLVISPITYLNLNVNEVIHVKNNLESLASVASTDDQQSSSKKLSLDRSNKSKSKSDRVVAVSKSTDVVHGNRAKIASDSDFYNNDIFFFIMILMLNREAIKQKEGARNKEDLVYKYPDYSNPNTTGKRRRHGHLIDLMETVRGLFLTLAFYVKTVDKSDQAICCSFEYDQQTFNVCFMSENFETDGIFILVLPSEQIDLNYFKIIAKNLNDTVKFTFGNVLHKILNQNINRNESNEEEIQLIRSQMDSFFSHLNKRLITSSWFSLFDDSNFYSNLSQANKDAKANIPKSKLEYIEAMKIKMSTLNRYYLLVEMRSKLIDSVPYYDLENSLKCDLDSAISDFEAQEFVDLENNYYINRRLFIIEGSCMFYRDSLIISHLNDSTTRRVYNYLVHYGIFNYTRNGHTNQFHIWKEIIMERSNTKSRHFLIVVGLREFLFAVILETGGPIARQFERNQVIEPDPFYIQQAASLLNDLNDNGIMSEINRSFIFGARQIIFNLDKFVVQRKKPSRVVQSSPSTFLRKRGCSRSKSPIRFQMDNKRTKSIESSRNQQQSHRRSSNSPAASRALVENKSNLLRNESNSVENVNSKDDNEFNGDKVYHSQKLQRHSSITNLQMQTNAQIGPLSENLSPKFLNIDSSYKYFSDLILNSSIIHYASSEGKLNGILYSSREFDLNSTLFTRVFFNYIQSCFKIKNLFDHSAILKENMLKGPNDDHFLIEQGVLFNLILDNPVNTKGKVKEISFWVVGRRKFKRTISSLDKNKEIWTNLGDFFICFHDEVEDVLIELAFDVGFSKIAC